MRFKLNFMLRGLPAKSNAHKARDVIAPARRVRLFVAFDSRG